MNVAGERQTQTYIHVEFDTTDELAQTEAARCLLSMYITSA